MTFSGLLGSGSYLNLPVPRGSRPSNEIKDLRIWNRNKQESNIWQYRRRPSGQYYTGRLSVETLYAHFV